MHLIETQLKPLDDDEVRLWAYPDRDASVGGDQVGEGARLRVTADQREA